MDLNRVERKTFREDARIQNASEDVIKKIKKLLVGEEL